MADKRKDNARNLSHEDRVKGGQRSAATQERDEQGQFKGKNRSDERRDEDWF